MKVAAWMKAVDKSIFEEEVVSMFGPSAVAPYAAAARDLQRFFASVSIHDADVCALVDGVVS